MIGLVYDSSRSAHSRKDITIMRVSSGVVIWRHAKGKLQILLVHQTNKPKSLWSIPKGGVKGDEDHEKAARREVLEETSVTLGPLEFLGYIDYGKTGKRVYCYMGECPGQQDVKSQEKDVDKAAFFDVQNAKKMVDKQQRKMINALQKIIAFSREHKRPA